MPKVLRVQGLNGTKRRGRVRGPAAALPILVLAAGCLMYRPVSVPSGGGTEGGWDDAIGSGRFHPNAPGQGWDDLRAAQIRFDRREAWHTEAPPGVQASFRRVLQEDGVGYGQWTVRGAAPEDRLRLQPATPVILAEPFDTIELAWGLSTPVAERPDEETGRRLDVALRFEDADGRPLRIMFTDLPHRPDGETVLVQRNLGYAFLEHARFPFRWLGMEASGWPEGATLTIGAMATYPQCRVPLVPEWREDGIRARPLVEEIAGRAPALPRAATRADGIVPPPRGDPPRHVRHREADGAWLLEARTERGIAAYRIPPPSDPSEIALHWNGRAVGTWAGLSWDSADPESAQAVAYVDGDDLVWAWPCGREQRFRLSGASLVVSLRGGRDVSGVRVGGVGRPFAAQSIPFLSDKPGAGPAVFAQAHASDGRLWASVAVDWTASGASVSEPPSGSDAQAIAVHLYRPATDGARPWLRERVALTLGPDLAAVLPRPPWAPPGEGRNAQVEARPWLGDDAPPAEARAALSPFGMDAWQSIASPAPEEATPWGRAIARDDLTPDDVEWSRDQLRRTPDGDWMPGDTPGSYARKRPPVRLATRRQLEQWGDRATPDAVMAGLTARPPWAFTDYDARSPGAAGFHSALYALAGQLRDLAESLPALRLGPDDHVFAYAGLLDAWVVGATRGQRLFHGRPRPEAAQQALREHGIGIGVGPLESVVATSPEHPNAEHALDRYLAVHLAYGLALRAPPLRYGARRIGRLYFAGGAVTRARAGRPVEALAFPDHTAPPADAASRIYVRYEGGLEVWVNLAQHHDWEVRVAGETYLLPPSGWVARSGEILALAVHDGEGRIDAARTPAFVYRDGRGRGGAFEGIDSAGALVLLRDPTRPSGVDVIDVSGEGEWRIAFERFDLGPNPRVDAHRIDNGAPVDAPSVTREGDWLRVRGSRAPTRYRLVR